MIPKEVSSKILGDVREKIAEKLFSSRGLYRSIADEILAISGTTGIECKKCNGEGHDPDIREFICHQCSGTGVIKHPWKVSGVLENGELPEHPFLTHPKYSQETNDTNASRRYGYETALKAMAGYRQVVE